MATLLSVNVGLPKNVDWHGHTVYTGIWKSPVEGARLARRLNLDGDGQGDLNGHGGEQRAVLAYQIDSYRHWQDHFGRADFGYGQFGENFTVDGLADDDVYIGDRYRIGEAEFEVTQPRVTCFRLGMRLGEPALPALLVAHRRPGFYLRVTTEGHVQAGDEIVRTRIGRHKLSVADIDALLYLPGRDVEQLRAAVDVPALSPGWQQSFRELLDAADNDTAVAAPPVGVEPGWVGFRPLLVSDIVAETPSVTSIYLQSANGDALPRPTAGQYLTLRVNAGDPPPVRSYSLSSSPDDTRYRISVKREGVVSSYLHMQLRAGAVIDAAAPRGEFVLTDDATAVLLISAGIGATPVLAMLHHLAAAGSSRDVWWIHAAHDAEQHAFADEAHQVLLTLTRAHERIFYTSLDASAPKQTNVLSGRPSLAALAGLGLPAGASAYVCGPSMFMADMRTALGELGIAPERVHTELFGALAPINPGVTDIRHVPPHQPPGPVGTGSRITFARSGLTVRWSGRDGSLLELAEACDVPTRFSCRSGVCHTCVTPVLSGGITYSPDPLEAPADGTVLVCCAQPANDLVLDM